MTADSAPHPAVYYGKPLLRIWSANPCTITLSTAIYAAMEHSRMGRSNRRSIEQMDYVVRES